MLPSPAFDLAETQLGLIGRYQLSRLLVRRGRVEAAIASPALTHYGERGIYRVRGCPVLPEQPLLAASLRARPDATATGPAVLSTYGFEGFDRDHPFVVVVRPGRRLRGVTFPYRPDPDPRRAVRRHGQGRLASPLDAFLESAPWLAVVGERPFRLAYDRLRFRHSTGADRLAERAAVLRSGCPEVTELLEVLELGGMDCESEGERSLRPLVMRFDPPPEAQVWLPTNDRVDLLFREVMVVLEYQGRVDHQGAANRAADDERTRRIERHGYRIHPVVAEDLRTPERLLQTLAGVLAVRAAQLGVTAPRLS